MHVAKISLGSCRSGDGSRLSRSDRRVMWNRLQRRRDLPHKSEGHILIDMQKKDKVFGADRSGGMSKDGK